MPGTAKSLDDGETHNLCNVRGCERCHCHHCHEYTLELAAKARVEKGDLLRLLQRAFVQQIDEQWLADARKAINSP